MSGGRVADTSIRELARSEVADVWRIDRSEVVDGIYHLEDGELVLRPEHYDVRGWPPSDVETYTPILLDCFERGGTFYGASAAAITCPSSAGAPTSTATVAWSNTGFPAVP